MQTLFQLERVDLAQSAATVGCILRDAAGKSAYLRSPDLLTTLSG